MSLLKITQMIEKEIQSGAPNLFWGKTLTDNCKHEIEESNVFNNCLTGITVKFSDKDEDSEIDFKSKEYSNDIEENQNPSKDIERDLDVLKKEVTFYDDLDETDYFDSEDEYWDSLKNKNIEDNPSPCLHCLTYHLPRSIQEYKECKSISFLRKGMNDIGVFCLLLCCDFRLTKQYLVKKIFKVLQKLIFIKK